MALTVDVEKRLGDFVLRTAFTAETGEALALLGASGSGKSLTLRCIAGIQRPDRGTITLDGRVLFSSEKGVDLPPQQRRVGFLFQQYALFPNMTALENIAAGAHALPRAQRRERAEELLRLLHLEGRGRAYPRQLSGGEQQRVALGRILAAQPEVILLDEPFSALDSHLKWQLELELRDILAEFSGPVVWVTHDRGEAFRNCGRVCVLEAGRSSPTLEMHRLLSDPGTVAAARLSGCRNCLPCAPGPRPGTVVLPDWGLTLACAAPWQAEIAAVGIRADSVRPAGPGEENAFRCQVVRVTEDVGHRAVLLRPEHARAGVPLLGMRADKGCWRALGDPAALWVAVAPGELMLLTP